MVARAARPAALAAACATALAAFALACPQPAHAALFAATEEITSWLEGALDYLGNLFAGNLVQSAVDALTAKINSIATDGDSLLTQPFSTLLGGSGGVWEMAASVQDAVFKPMAVSVLALATMVQLVRKSEHADGTASLPAVREVASVFVFYAVFSALIARSGDICAGIYDLSTRMVRMVAGLDGVEIPVGEAFWAEMGYGPAGGTALGDTLRALVMVLVADLMLSLTSIVVYASVWMRAIQLYVYFMVAPLPFALLGAEPTRQMGVNYVRNFAALAFAAVVMMLVLAVYPHIVAGIVLSNTFVGSGFVKIVAASAMICICLTKAGSWSREIMGG